MDPDPKGPKTCTVIRFVWVSAKFGTCTVVSINGTLVEDKMRGFKGECAHFSFNKCPIYTYDITSEKFSTNSNKTDNSVRIRFRIRIPNIALNYLYFGYRFTCNDTYFFCRPVSVTSRPPCRCSSAENSSGTSGSRAPPAPPCFRVPDQRDTCFPFSSWSAAHGQLYVSWWWQL